jgi:hypothetical protein
MDKYEPLGRFLTKQKAARVAMTFEQVEKVIGAKLPRSAYKHRPWWANDATGHAHARVWLEAGFQTEHVDMAARKFVFRRTETAQSEAGGMAEAVEKSHDGKRPRRPHPIVGALKGLARVAPGVDLTKPALDPDEWEEILAEKYGKDERGV